MTNSTTTTTPKLVPPLTYQGGKGRIAGAIVDAMSADITTGRPFFDLCCGSGAVSVELVCRGFAPERITMVDAGPWGLFWEAVGAGRFDVARFRDYCAAIPADRSKIQAHVQSLFDQPAGEDALYVFPIIQASTFGGAAVWLDGMTWRKGGGLRSYWMPTATSNRRSPVNPMMPLPLQLAERVAVVCERMRGVCGVCGDARCVLPPPGSLVYIDPPYRGTAGYGHEFDAVAHARRVMSSVCYVSESVSLSPGAVEISVGRAKGGMNGAGRAKAAGEWLSVFNRDTFLFNHD